MILLRPRPAFIAAVNARIAWLGEHRSEDELDHFLWALDLVRDRIRQTPKAGPVVKRDARHVLRMRLFPKPLPYLLYYAHALRDPLREIDLVRLYASGQRRAKVAAADWPW